MAIAWHLHRRNPSWPDDQHVPVRLSGGGTVGLRPLRRGETGPLEDVFDAMSLDSRAQRYFTPMTRLPSAMATALTDVDGHHHVAWVAVLGGRPVGIGRYLLDDAGVAEVAFEVADAVRGVGIGSMLLDAVTTVAAAHGVRRVRASVLPGNHPSRRMVARLGVHLALADGLLEGDGPLRLLDPPRVDRRSVVALACRVAAVDDQDGPCEAVNA
ncbi:GNAT family N-acetyltransferase [Nocardioides sp. MAHUQ-72]|uniref:GNAT family N-acetyltransferase n=1 Tax=unclassified Nocardioides TaxID=2615069 RepID=UPI003612E7D0